ncbi:MAG: AAA family ATPase, partial [Cyclobacteriaceae bacterium]|nr:AAA family ATPase [Cyclobacteriaceae bacterium]
MGKGKAIIVLGARQVGKTTMVRKLLEEVPHLFLNGDDPADRELLDRPNTEQLRSVIGKNKTVFIDEAQRIPDIGLSLKIIVD